MYLVIAEKPSVSQSLAKVLGAYKRENGYLEGSGYLVSWCLGHLAEYALPEAYDSRFEKWEFSDLPIVPDVWKLLVAKDKKEQFDNLKKLLNRTDVEYVVNACDAGREGELILKGYMTFPAVESRSSGCGSVPWKMPLFRTVLPI